MSSESHRSTRTPWLSWLTRLKVLSGAAVALMHWGCASSSSSGLVKGFPSDENPTVNCYMRAYELLPPFVYWRNEDLPKRAILIISLNDANLEKPVLRYRAKLKVAPPKLRLTARLEGRKFLAQVVERTTGETWKFEFKRDPAGLFQVVSREGEFR